MGHGSEKYVGALRTPVKIDKGCFDGSCNRMRCQETPARWWHILNTAYYCRDCAQKINERNPPGPELTKHGVVGLLCVDVTDRVHPEYEYHTGEPHQMRFMPLMDARRVAENYLYNNPLAQDQSVLAAVMRWSKGRVNPALVKQAIAEIRQRGIRK